jgi:TonB family protein
MTQRIDILDERESVRNPLFGSLALHVGMVALAGLWAVVGNSGTERWGDPKSLGGGAVGITAVDRIPLPSRQGRINPVANDTESQVPSAPVKPQPKPKQAVKEDPNAIALKSRNAKAPGPPTVPQKYTAPAKPNQVYSSTGQAATSPMFSQAPGGGGVGSGSQNPFGNRFGYYEQLIRDKVARNWRSQELGKTASPPVVVTFDILRNGSVQNVRVSRPSGNFALDQSAQRAILMSNPFPPLPAQFERDVATIDFTFRLE